MKEELLLLIEEFMTDVNWHNLHIKTSIDDDVELTFENFIKWLRSGRLNK